MSNSSVETIEAAIREALTAHGPMTEDDLHKVLAADGVDLGPHAEDLLADVLDSSDDLVMGLLDETFAFLPALLDGRVLTHRLTALEAEHDLLEWGPDVEPVSMLTETESYLQLTDGSPIIDALPGFDDEVFEERGVSPQDVSDEGALLLESGRIAALGARAGDLVGLRVTAAGFDLVTVADVADGDAGARIAEVVAEHAEAPMMFDLAVWTALAADVKLLRDPATPLGEQVTSRGLVVDGEWVAREGFHFDVWQDRQNAQTYKVRHHLPDDEANALVGALRLHEEIRELLDAVMDASHDDDDLDDVVLQVLQQHDADRTSTAAELDPTFVSDTLAFMEEPAFAQAFLAETAFDDERAAAALGLFAENMEDRAPASARPAMRWLRGRAFELLGDVEQAERTFRGAESMDPLWPLTLMSLARLAGDRGDAERGLALLRRADAPEDHPLVELLQAFQTPPRPKIARNQPCWCGSGRKYKQCHLHREQLPLEDRAGWLYQKPTSFMLDGASTLLFEVAQERSRYWNGPDPLERGLKDPLTADAVLFEGGVFEEFLAARGMLLPPDEAMMAAQWLLVERSVHEAVSVRSGESMTWRDVRTGDVVEIQERTASRQVKPGELYCARVVPVGNTMQIFGGLEPVSLGERDELIALLDSHPEPMDLVAFLSRRFAPPTVLNSEREPLVLCEATVRVSDPVGLAAALDQAYDRAEDTDLDMPVWFEHVTTDGMQRLSAELDLLKDELRFHANSENRFERVLATIMRLDPGAMVLTETREPVDFSSREHPKTSGTAPSSNPFGLPDDPAIVSALDEMILQYEERWLDDHIPALAGYTPRECAEDPTRRPDLIALLNSFPQDEQPGQMSVSRLRSALGLG